MAGMRLAANKLASLMVSRESVADACSGDQLHGLGMSNQDISDEGLQLVVEEPSVGCRFQHNKI